MYWVLFHHSPSLLHTLWFFAHPWLVLSGSSCSSLLFMPCSWQRHLSRSSLRCHRPLSRCGDSESTVSPEDQGVCMGWSQRSRLEWTYQRTRTMQCAAWRRWVPFDRLCPFWRRLAWLCAALQGLPEAVPHSTENGKKPLWNRHRLRDLLQTRWSASPESRRRWHIEEQAEIWATSALSLAERCAGLQNPSHHWRIILHDFFNATQLAVGKHGCAVWTFWPMSCKLNCPHLTECVCLYMDECIKWMTMSLS